MSDKLRLGGMALRNGLLVHGPTHWAAAVRARDSELRVASGRKPRLGGPDVPGVRGLLRLGEAVAVIPLVKRALPDAELPMQDMRTLGAAGLMSVAAAALRRRGPRTLAREAVIAGASTLPALLALRSGELAAYHGVEHKSIAAYERDADAATAAKEHDRCGSHLLAPMLTGAAAGGAALRRAGVEGPLADSAVGLASVGFAVELFAWSERHPHATATRILRRPGHELQRLLGTREPTPAQLAVGEAALTEILRVELASGPARQSPGPAEPAN